MIDLFTADELDQLARRIAQIRPMSNGNPHAFYEERSEVASEIRKLAARLRNRAPEAAPIEAPDVRAPIGRQRPSHTVRHVEGRTIMVLTRSSGSGLASDNRP